MYIVPSPRHLTGDERRAFIDAYIKSKADVPCKWFERGSCHYKHTCFYAHKRHGVDYKQKEKEEWLELQESMGNDGTTVLPGSIESRMQNQRRREHAERMADIRAGFAPTTAEQRALVQHFVSVQGC
jgi:hypothetical protein